MTTMKMPQFLQNENWYTTPKEEGIDSDFFEDGRGYHIRDDAPQEAKDSYNKFFSAIENTVDLP